MTDKENFLKGMTEAHDRFVIKVKEQKWNTQLRLEAENILVAFDQMFKVIKETPVSPSSGQTETHKDFDIELFGCPMCGSNAKLRQYFNTSVGVDYFAIICEHNHTFTTYSDNKDTLLAEWGRPQPEKREVTDEEITEQSIAYSSGMRDAAGMQVAFCDGAEWMRSLINKKSE